MKIGNSDITNIYLGSSAVSKVYLGDVQVYPSSQSGSPVSAYVYSIYSQTYGSQYGRYQGINTGIRHSASTMSVRIQYYAESNNLTNNSRIVGYETDYYNTVFILAGQYGGSFTYTPNSATNLSLSGDRDITIGDSYVYDNDLNTYLYSGTTQGVVASAEPPIWVDLSNIKVKRVIIKDGNTTIFDGKAALMKDGHVGLYDATTDNLVYYRYSDYDETAPVPSLNKTLVVTSVEEATNTGMYRGCLIDNIFDFVSDYDDAQAMSQYSFTAYSPFSGSYNDEDRIITIVGPFSGNSYTLNCGGLVTICDQINNDITFSFSGDSASIVADYTSSGPDPACECSQMGGEWDDENQECIYPEDPCINDPCLCDPNPEECYCNQNGGIWDSENQVCNYE